MAMAMRTSTSVKPVVSDVEGPVLSEIEGRVPSEAEEPRGAARTDRGRSARHDDGSRERVMGLHVGERDLQRDAAPSIVERAPDFGAAACAEPLQESPAGGRE